MRKFPALILSSLLVVAMLFPVVPLFAQVQISPLVMPRKQFFDASGRPLAGGHVCTYRVGTTTPQVTYTDYTGSVQNQICDPATVPSFSDGIVLDAGGYASIYINCAQNPFKIVVYDQNLVLQWSEDGVQYPGNCIAQSCPAGQAMVGISANGTISCSAFCVTCGGGSTLPDKLYTLLPDCSNGGYVGIEDTTPIESFFAQTFSNLGVGSPTDSNCFVADTTDTGVDQSAEIKEGSGFIRDTFPWTVKFYLRIDQTTNMRLWMIFTDNLATNFQTSDDPSLFAQDVAAFRFSKGTGAGPDPGAGDTFWTMVSMASGAVATIAPTAVAPDTNTHKYEISYDGVGTLTYKIDGTSVGTQAQTFTDGLGMFWYITITSLDAATAVTFDFYGLQMTEQTIHVGP